MEKKLSELEEKLELLQGICLGILDRLQIHESMQGQKETAIFNHIESVKRSYVTE